MRRRALLVIGAVGLIALLAVGAGAVVAFPWTPTPRATSRSVELPDELEGVVFRDCFGDGLGAIGADRVESSVTTTSTGFEVLLGDTANWQVVANRRGVTVRREDGSLDTDAVGSQASRAVVVAQAIYGCLAQYRFADLPAPTESGSRLVQQYKYDTAVLWPCFVAHGLDPGSPPTRADFADSLRASAVTPFAAGTATVREIPRILATLQDCPLRPAYLG